MHLSEPSLLQLRDLLPSGAGSCAIPLHPADAARIEARFPAVRVPDTLAAAVPKRRLQYAAGRHCARTALEQLGMAAADAVGRGADNLPAWPPAVVGSISHTDDVAWAAALRASEAAGLGIDVERLMDAPRAARLQSLICSAAEMELAATRQIARPEFLTLAFSFKESLYKCVFPLVRRFFGYRDATVTDIDLATGRIAARLDVDLADGIRAGTRFTGRFLLSGTHVFTSVHLRAEGSRLRIED